jgi:hypothetical protein
MGKIAATTMLAAMLAATATIQAQAGGTILKPADLQKLVPASVYYHGQTATTQVRNSGGVKFSDGAYVLAYMVDTSGYSSDISAKYQAYLISEAAIKVESKSLPAGVYGIGFVGGKFIVTDVGGHDVLTAAASNDSALTRPVPLKIEANPGGGYRLYAGKKFVAFTR